MKKNLLFAIAFVLSLGLKAQCPLTQAVDFTATDCHGTEIHLFDILDSGQYALIDFFYTTCGPCQQATPKVVESYYAMGCNMHDVYYIEISDRNNDAQCQTWVNTYGVEYPTIGSSGGGGTITNQYGIGYFPTVILIAPDHSIVIQDLWPINNAQTVISALEAQGLEQHDCNAPTPAPEVAIGIDQVTDTEVTATFTPNELCTMFYYTIATDDEIQQWMAAAGLELPQYLQSYGFPADDVISHTFTDLTPQTEYTIYAVGTDSNNVLGEVSQETVFTTNGGNVEIIPDFTAPDIDGHQIHLYDILDSGQAVFINFFLIDDPASADVLHDVNEAYRLYGCNANDVFFMEITPNGHDEECHAWVENHSVAYPTISRDGGGNTIVQSIPVGFYPTLMLIRPDHSIAVRDIYPPTLEFINNAMAAEGYEQHECIEETLTFDIDTLWVSQNQISAPLTIFNNTAEPLVHLNKITIDTDLDWYYFMYGDQQISLNEEFDIPIAQGQGIQLEVWMNIYNKELIYPVLSFENTLETVSLVTAFDWIESVQETDATSLTLFPNPANESLTLKGESIGTVCIYNTLGQKVDEFHTDGNELNINTTGYANGLYLIKTGETMLRFIIAH